MWHDPQKSVLVFFMSDFPLLTWFSENSPLNSIDAIYLAKQLCPLLLWRSTYVRYSLDKHPRGLLKVSQAPYIHRGSQRLTGGAQGSISKVAHHLSHRRDSWWWCSVLQIGFSDLGCRKIVGLVDFTNKDSQNTKTDFCCPPNKPCFLLGLGLIPDSWKL